VTIYQALAHRFQVDSPDPELRRHLETLFEGLRCPDPAPAGAAVRYRLDEEPQGWYTLRRDEELLVNSDRPGLVLAHLLWQLNRSAVGATTDRIVLHAAAAASGGDGVLLPAPQESGKATLVAGLVRRGFQYLSDEAVAIDPLTLEMQPYAKPLSLDPGSWALLPDLEPAVDPRLRPWLGDQWQVAPTSIRPDAVAAPTPARLVVLPRYDKGAETTIESVSGGRALLELAQCTFEWQQHGARALYTLAALLRKADCYRLVVGDLEDACDLVIDALG
jgi:hypothetical protein